MGGPEAGFPKKVFGFLIISSPLSWISASFRRDIGQISTWKVFFFFDKNIFIMKNLPISVQRRKPVWIRACKGTLGIGTKAFKHIFLKHLQK